MGKIVASILYLSSVCIFISGCGSTATAIQPTIPGSGIQVISSDKPREKKAIAPPETIRQPNCGGSSTVSSHIERSYAIVHAMDVGGGATLKADGTIGLPGVASVGAGAEVAAKYGVTYGQEERLSRSLTVSAKEGTSMVHTIQQYEYWETGEIVITANNQTWRIPYKFRTDFGIQLLESKNIGNCTGAQPTSVQPGAVATSPTSEVVVVTSTPSPIQAPTSTSRVAVVSGTFANLWRKYSADLGSPLPGNESDRFFTGAEMPFEGGHMFSVSFPSKRIWVVMGSKRGAWTGTGTWREYIDTWQNGEPDFSCPKQAEYPKQPIRGFGRVWCNNPEVPAALGWAFFQEQWPDDISPGSGIQRFQEFEGGFIFRDSDGWTNRLAYVCFKNGKFIREAY